MSKIAQRFLDLNAIITEPTPPVKWAIDGLIAEQDFTFVSGIGGIGKSYVAISTAISLSTQQPLFGHFSVAATYNVLYIDMEMAETEGVRRFSRMLRGSGVEAGTAPANLWVGVRGTLQLDDITSVKELDEFVAANSIHFIVIDSYRRVYSGDDKDSMTSNRVFRVLSGLRARYGTGFIFVAHWRKKSIDSALNDPTERLLGSVDQRNMIDCHLAVMPGGEPDTLTIMPDKSRHGDGAADQFRIRFNHDDPTDEDGPFKLVYINADDGKRELAITDALIAAGQDKWTSYDELGVSTRLKPKALQRGIKRLILAQRIEREKVNGSWCVKLKAKQ